MILEKTDNIRYLLIVFWLNLTEVLFSTRKYKKNYMVLENTLRHYHYYVYVYINMKEIIRIIFILTLFKVNYLDIKVQIISIFIWLTTGR